MSNQQIGVKLGISALTVKNHVQKILRKLGASNRAQAVAIAMSLNAWGDHQPTGFKDSEH
jgi:DNA-binding CsgD family transcriptional regulator